MSIGTSVTHGFFKELKDRHVLRVAGFYLLICVPVMEAGDIILPRLGMPDWSLTVVLWLIAIGFPIALAIAWSYEITADGVQTESEARRTQARRLGNGRSVDFVVIALLLLAVAYLAVDKLSAKPAPTIAASGTPSIAVLPFVNMSDDASNEYFSDGVSEELLNSLARVPKLRVAGRTSSFYYKGRNEDLRDIGRNLGVATVLEGSVRKDGDRVRVTAQLINVADGFHLWSDSYDYTLDDVFAVQNRIAQAVVEVLEIQLLGKERELVRARPTTSTQAHTAYLRGRYELHRRTKPSIMLATDFFADATSADPDYAAAWVGLAESQILQFVNHKTLTKTEAIDGATAALARALELDPELAEAHAALGLLRMQSSSMEGAEEAFQRALQLDPNYSEAWHWYGLLVGGRGDRAGAIEKLRTAVDIDPLHRVARVNLGHAIMNGGDVEGARRFFHQSIELEPDYPLNYLALAGIEASMAWPRPTVALALVDQALDVDADHLVALAMQSYLALELGDVAGARAAVARMQELNPAHPKTLGSQAGVVLYAEGPTAARDNLRAALDRHGEQLGDQLDMFRGFLGIISNDYVAAVEAWERSCPELFAAESVLPEDKVNIAGLIAYSLQKVGRDTEAQGVIEMLGDYIKGQNRFGPMGFALADVELAALQGQTNKAIGLLRNALEQGYRNRLLHDGWTLLNYPVFKELANSPEYVELVTTLDTY